MKRICKNCGLTYGSHLATTYFSMAYNREFPYNWCPGHEGRMDWGKGPGTTFEPSGNLGVVEYNTPAKGLEDE
jgi:hypothetical protein